MWHQKVLFILALSLISTAQAAPIVNGDFSKGFDNWLIDTDGGAGSTNDFSSSGGVARIEADFYDVAGDLFSSPINDVFFGNTLSQDLDFSGSSAPVSLSFDYMFGGEDGDVTIGERFSVFFSDSFGTAYGTDGSLGFLIDPTSNYSSGSFSVQIDPADFVSINNLNLSFLLEVGADSFGINNGLGSFLTIDNVSLGAVAPVPEPSTLILLLIGSTALLSRRFLKNCSQF